VPFRPGRYSQLAHVVIPNCRRCIKICMSTERVIVQREISDALIDAVLALVAKLKPGNPMELDDVSIGPVFSEAQAKKIIDLVETAQQDGATVLVGDVKHDVALVKPHVLIDVKPGMKIWDRESFGPGESHRSALIQVVY